MFQKLIILLLLFVAEDFLAQNDESWKVYDDSKIAVIHISMDAADKELLFANPASDILRNCEVHFKNAFIDTTLSNVGIRIRGNTSRAAEKKSFKVTFNGLEPGRRFYGLKDLNLNGEHNDPSIFRTKLCFDIFNRAGMASSRTAHAAIYINNEYYGLYISVEHYDDTFLDKNYNDPSGNLWKCLYPADLSFRGTNPDYYKTTENGHRTYELKTNESIDDYSKLADFIGIINNLPYSDFQAELEKKFEVKEFVKYLAMDVLLASWDDYTYLMNNYYIYYEPKTDKMNWIPYDYDNTIGVDWMGVDWTQNNIYSFKKSGGSRPLTENVIKYNDYLNLYSHFIEFYSQNLFKLSVLEPTIDSIKTKMEYWTYIDTFRTKDYGFTYDDWKNSFSSEGYSNLHVKNGIKEFINKRNASAISQLNYKSSAPIVYDIKYFPEYPMSDDSIYIYASVFDPDGLSEVNLSFHPKNLTVVENYPMIFSPVEGTTIVEKADRWIGVIPPLGDGGSGEFQINPKDNSNEASLFPRNDGITISSLSTQSEGLVINEIMAINDSLIADETGKHPDWVEIYNSSNTPIDLSGKYLTDKEDNLTKWRFPAGVFLLQPGEYKVIWCSEDTGRGIFHTNFKLNGDGEFIAIVNIDGTSIIDSLTFGGQISNISFGRYPDGAGDWRFMVPTPAGPNVPTGVNEIEIKPAKFNVNVYPNPFNPSTNIDYSISQRNDVNIKIFDLLGREIWSKKELALNPGSYKLKWNAVNNSGSKVVSGIYLLSISTGKNSISKKLMFLK